jgi:hypothetical protein
VARLSVGAFALATAFALALAASTPGSAQDRDTFTPMPLDQGFGPMDVGPSAIPPAEIIQRFSARETELQEALTHYTWRRQVRVQTLNDVSHAVDGEWYEVDDVLLAPDGSRVEKTVDAPPSTLRRIMLSPSDLHDLQHGYVFVLTTADLPTYNISYVGRQQVDEIYCYVFDVSPRQIRKDHRYLLGRIWVDDHDFQIVITNGRLGPDDTKKGQEDLHTPFMTWREPIDGRYWFPTYVRGEGILHFSPRNRRSQGADVHIREVIKYTGYKRDAAPSQTPSAAPQPRE